MISSRTEKGCLAPDNPKRKEVTARLESDLYEQLRVAAFRLRISQNQAIIEALRIWLRKIKA
jgi:hypothetical protein